MMYCPKCGSMIDGNVCNFCGASVSGGANSYGQTPYNGANVGAGANPYAGSNAPRGGMVADFSDFLVPNIILTILCACSCRLIGAIVPGIGLVFSILSRNALTAGDLASARSRATVAKAFFWISLALILLAIVCLVVYLTSEEGQLMLREAFEE